VDAASNGIYTVVKRYGEGIDKRIQHHNYEEAHKQGIAGGKYNVFKRHISFGFYAQFFTSHMPTP
jgi:hypothetical protein